MLRLAPFSALRQAPTAWQRGLSLRLLSTAPTPTKSDAPSATTPASTGPLPYRVGRTNSLNFPVYQPMNASKTSLKTVIKKVEGNVTDMAKHLHEELGLEATVNPRTKHVIIKGRHRDTVLAWLEGKGL